MFIEPLIIWVPSGFSGYKWLDTKIVLEKKNSKQTIDMTFRVENEVEFSELNYYGAKNCNIIIMHLNVPFS